MPIRRLSEEMINRIAAGEVVERPASVVKELVENAIDAGARRIEIVTAAGGIALLRITDNGAGMSPDDLALAVERHCTSKLDNGLDRIETLGFRGEALASIGAVARLTLASRKSGTADAYEIGVEGGRLSPIRPAALSAGTRVEVRDLFFATPARLKFLRSERAETAAITDMVKRLAMAHPEVRFSLSGADRNALDFPAAAGPEARLTRLNQVIGEDFSVNSVPLDALREGVRLEGHAGFPTYSRANSLSQYLFVNGRSVRDKQLLGALRAAYSDQLKRDRHPVAALFVSLDPALVDVNVHPAKAEVRFRDPGLVRGLIVGAIREALSASGLRASSRSTDAIVTAFRPFSGSGSSLGARSVSNVVSMPRSFARPVGGGFAEPLQAAFAATASPSAETVPTASGPEEALARPLGAARAQIHETYIVAQTEDGIVIVDQHAAHERLVYEKLKRSLTENGVARQILLIPEVVDLPEEDVARLDDQAEELARFGLVVERFGPGAIAVRETPSMLGTLDAQQLIRDLADEMAEWEEGTKVRDRLDRLASTMACHGSVRAGRRLKPAEMDALLREIEATPNASECNHGRPTFIELKLGDIERLFGRR